MRQMILAGNYHEFVEYCRRMGIPPDDSQFLHAKWQLAGLLPQDVVIIRVGTWRENPLVDDLPYLAIDYSQWEQPGESPGTPIFSSRTYQIHDEGTLRRNRSEQTISAEIGALKTRIRELYLERGGKKVSDLKSEEIYWCRCGRNTVDAGQGCDTCWECLRDQ